MGRRRSSSEGESLPPPPQAGDAVQMHQDRGSNKRDKEQGKERDKEKELNRDQLAGVLSSGGAAEAQAKPTTPKRSRKPVR